MHVSQTVTFNEKWSQINFLGDIPLDLKGMPAVFYWFALPPN